MFDTKACGCRIRELRHRRGITQDKLATDLHVSESHIRKTEKGQRSASIDLYIVIAQYFNVSLDYLFTGMKYTSDQIKVDIEDVITRLHHISDSL